MLLNENTLKNLIRSVVKSQYSKKLNESLGRSRRFLNEENEENPSIKKQKKGQALSTGEAAYEDEDWFDKNSKDWKDMSDSQKKGHHDMRDDIRGHAPWADKAAYEDEDWFDENSKNWKDMSDSQKKGHHDMRDDIRGHAPWADKSPSDDQYQYNSEWWDGSHDLDDEFGEGPSERGGYIMKSIAQARDTTFIVPKLPRGYYDLAKILINDNTSQNEKLSKNKTGFVNHDFSLFKNEFLNYNPENIKQDLAQEMPKEFNIDNVNKLLSDEKFLARALDKYFQNTNLKPGEKIVLSDFTHFARVNALKMYLMKDKDMSVSKENVDQFLSDTALQAAKSNYKEFDKRAGSLTKLMKEKNGLASDMTFKQLKSKHSP